MFVDSSAILAILLSEDDAPLLIEKMKHSSKRYINPLVTYEVVRGMAKIITGIDKPYSNEITRDCSKKFGIYTEEMRLVNMPLDGNITRLAIDALALYGKAGEALITIDRLNVPLLLKWKLPKINQSRLAKKQ